jgi:hypothetical protein
MDELAQPRNAQPDAEQFLVDGVAGIVIGRITTERRFPFPRRGTLDRRFAMLLFSHGFLASRRGLVQVYEGRPRNRKNTGASDGVKLFLTLT